MLYISLLIIIISLFGALYVIRHIVLGSAEMGGMSYALCGYSIG